MTNKNIKQTILTDEIVLKINSVLESGEPNNISVDPYSNYSGYAPQAVIDAINSAIGYDKWGFDDLSSELHTVDTKDGKGLLAVAQVRVWISDRDTYRTAYGQGRVTKGDIGDGKKSAQTDALKKALSYFSIGNRAYLGLLDPNKKAQPKPVETISPVVTSIQKYIETVQGKAHSRAYYMCASKAGLTSEQAHDLVVKNFKLNSYTEVTKEQLNKAIDALNKKMEANDIFDGDLPSD